MGTELHDAAVAGDVRAVLKLLDSGTDPNAIDTNGATALHLAVVNGRPRVVEALLSHGANPNATNGYGEPVISDIEGARTLQALLGAGASLSAKLADRLMYDAIRFGNSEVIDVLVGQGVKPRKWHIEAAREEWAEGDADISERVFVALKGHCTNPTESRAGMGK